jgi:Flp pilus assembly protein TadD
VLEKSPLALYVQRDAGGAVMAINKRRRRSRLLEAARGYLELDMPRYALKQIDAIDDPEQCAFDAFRLRGEALRQQEEYVGAVKAFRRALVENPNSIDVLLGLAWCFKRTDQLQRAINAMKRAYEVAPHEPIVLYNLSCYFSLAGDKEQALSWLGRSLRLEKSLRKLIPGESDFDALRDDPDFQFIAGIKKPSDAT